MRIKKIFIISLIFSILFLGWLYAVNDTSEITLKITWLGIRHGTPDNLNLWTVTYSNFVQEVTWQFNSGFWIEDLLWLATWHYTTVQCDGLYWPNWSIITWVYLKNWNTSPVRLLWNAWNVLISTSLNDYVSIYNPIVYIYKPSSPSNVWLANKYSDKPNIKLLIPSNTTAGDYSWTIVFTLYMNDN